MRFDHECPDWDYMRINESCDEFHCCSCYDDPDARAFREMHSRYHLQIMKAYQITEKKNNGNCQIIRPMVYCLECQAIHFIKET